MNKATISKLKNNLSEYLRRVRAGHSVVIYDRDVPIARIERIEAGGRAPDRLASLRARGLVRPPKRPLNVAQLQSKLPKLPPRSRLLEALLDERESTR
jgi:prevent-host-death family protein